MGNVMSEEEEAEFLEEGFDLDSPEADKQINYGTSAPNCQPKHTQSEDSKPAAEGEEEEDAAMEGMEVSMDETNMQKLTDNRPDPLSPKHRRDSDGTTSEGEHQGKRQHVPQQQREKKLSYIQMAKMGYQELINAIIRPPRADYKVRCSYLPMSDGCEMVRAYLTGSVTIKCSRYSTCRRGPDVARKNIFCSVFLSFCLVLSLSCVF
jgi:hypothetical protein